MNQKLFLTFLLLVSGASSAAAQEIQGRVRYADSHRPVVGALVRCNGTGGFDQRSTDPDGKFYFRVSPGHYDLSVRVPGYREETRSFDLTDSRQSEYADFRMRPDPSAKPINPTGTIEATEANVPPKAREEFEKGSAAIALGQKENLEKGVLHLEKAVAIFPQYLKAQLMLGATYMDLQQFDKAEKVLKKTIEIDPKAANALFALGEIYLRQKKLEDAEKNLLQGLKVDDASAPAHLTLGRAYWEIGTKITDTEQARPILVKAYDQAKRAIELNPNLADAHLLKGNLLFRVRRAAEAQHEYEEYLRLDPKGAFAEQTRALVERIKKALAEVKP